MNWLIYLAEANVYLVVFYLVYRILLAADTHYQLNRAYLLLSSAVAFVLPLVQLNFLKPVAYIGYVNDVATAAPAVPVWQTVLIIGYFIGAGITLLLFSLKLIQLWRLTKTGIKVDGAYHHLIKIEEANTAFSFFNYLFIGSEIPAQQLVIDHELVHIRQKHSADILFTELLKIVNWFNPAVYLLQTSIRTLHEYIADEKTAQLTNNPLAYASFLVDNAYGYPGPAITHSFFNHNLLKKRIIMLDQKRSGKLARLKYLVAVPLCAALLSESTLGFSKSYGIINIGRQKTITVAGTDTVRKSKPTVHNVPLNPNQKVHGKGVKIVGRDTVNYGTPPPPPPLDPDSKHRSKSNKKLPPPPPPMPPKTGKTINDPGAPKPAASKIKFPPPTPPKKTGSNKVTQVQFAPPAKDLKAVSFVKAKPAAQEIRIEEPVSAQPNAAQEIRLVEPVKVKSNTVQEIRIKEPVKVQPTAVQEIRIKEPVKKQDDNTQIKISE